MDPLQLLLLMNMLGGGQQNQTSNTAASNTGYNPNFLSSLLGSFAPASSPLSNTSLLNELLGGLSGTPQQQGSALGGTSIPANFWNMFFGGNGNGIGNTTSTQPRSSIVNDWNGVRAAVPPSMFPTAQAQNPNPVMIGSNEGALPAGVTLTPPPGHMTGGYGGNMVNPEYTAAYGNMPYDQYLAQWNADYNARKAAYDAQSATWGNPRSINPATGQIWGRRMAFAGGQPMPYEVPIWQNPSDLSPQNDYNAFRSAGQGVQPFLGQGGGGGMSENTTPTIGNTGPMVGSDPWWSQVTAGRRMTGAGAAPNLGSPDWWSQATGGRRIPSDLSPFNRLGAVSGTPQAGAGYNQDTLRRLLFG